MSRRTPSVRSGNTVDMEVANLFKLNNKNQFTNALMALRQRYNDVDLVDKIQEVFIQRHSSIVKSAKKFATAVREKYASQNVPFHQLLMKARAHGKKHHLSEAEFSEFQRIYEQELAGSGSSEVVIPMTSMMKALGTIHGESAGHVDEADYRNLQEIITLHESSRPLHAQVLLQAIQYGPITDAFATASTSIKSLQNPADHIHPLLVALFLTKIKTIDEHFIFSNMSGIVKSRYNKQPLTTRPDYELLYNLITDPNDVVCDTRAPYADLLHRCNLQNQLWNSVLHLRNGQFINPSLREFMTSVDVCRLNKYDNPDLIYGRHDGTIIKRLFSAFSFRPTTVATLPVANLFAYNPYSQNIRPTITAIPMINVRLGVFNQRVATSVALSSGKEAPSDTIDLEQALTQTNQFIEGNMIVHRHTQVMFSREVIVFYIDRRSTMIPFTNGITNMARLPASISGFESINNMKIEYKDAINVNGGSGAGGQTFNLRSALISETQDIEGKNVVVGSSAVVLCGSTWMKYQPNKLNNTSPNPAHITPIIEGVPKDDLQSKATILIYVNNAHEDKDFLF